MVKYLKLSPLCLNLSDISIWSTFTNIKSIGCLDLWNSFLLSLILSNFSVFSLIFYIKNKKLLLTPFLILNQFLILFSLVLFNFVFFFLWQVFIMLPWLFFHSFFVLCIILSSFFFKISFFCFLQDF